MIPQSMQDNSVSRHFLWRFAFIPLILICLFSSLAQAADEESTKAVRRASPEGVSVPKAQKRVALVIGNNEYKEAPLRNPTHDAEDIANVLRGLGFTVQTKINADQRQMEEAVGEFVREIQNGDVGLFYFSGHGVQVSGDNYLIPVGGSIETETDVRYKAVNAGLILGKMEESRNRTNIFILDACRNNPFKGFRSLSKGLTMMDAPVGTFIAYATAPGSVAADGTDRNSPYAKHLMLALKGQGVPIEQVFKQVLREVRKETEGKQIPWTASSLQDDFYFNPGDILFPVAASTVAPSVKPTESPLVSRFSDYRAKSIRLQGILNRGDRSAHEGLNNMYKDQEAVKWFRQASDQGDPVAQFMLGRMFILGIGVSKDAAEGLKWLRKAAEQGNASAQENLGLVYHWGSFGLGKDYLEASKWYKKAAEQENTSAQYRLGILYKNGNGVAKDQSAARKWFQKAADQGHEDAKKELRKMGATTGR